MKIVTGMHRSGTSLVAHLLHQMGADFGPRDECIPPDPYNPDGYFENANVVFMNDRLLMGQGAYDHELTRRTYLSQRTTRYWRRRMGSCFLALGRERLVAFRGRKQKAQIKKIGRRCRNLFVKDPRFSITLGQWLESAKIDRILYCYRDPRLVVRSLQRRDHIPLWLGYRIWIWYVESFLRQARSQRIVFVKYENLIKPTTRSGEWDRLSRFAGYPLNLSDAEGILQSVRGRRDEPTVHKPMPKPAESLFHQLDHMHQLNHELRISEKQNIGHSTNP